MTRPFVLFVGGPTAAGKTALSLHLAQRYDAVVLSADAMQVYRGLDIGTAKASDAERALVPHEGIDVRDPGEPFHAADAVALADAILARGDRLIVAGGTHMYHQAIRRGLVKTPPVDPALRAELEARDDLHETLQQLDPVLAERLHPNDRVRLVRGVEVAMTGPMPLSQLQAEHARSPDRVRSVGLWVDRDDLRERIGQRLAAMMDQGYLDEVRGLLDAGVDRLCKPMRSLGYRHLADHLLDGIALDEAIRRTERDTWTLARKQRNWRKSLGYLAADDAVDLLPASWSDLGEGPR